MCEPIFNRPLAEISFGQVLLRLFQTARRFNMEVQPQLVLLQKTLLNIEGLGRQLYPQLDLWTTAKPFLERWMRQQLGPGAFWRHVRENAPLWSERLPALPNKLYEVVEKAAEGRLETRLRDDQLARLQQEIRRANRRTLAAVTGSGLLLTAAVLYPATPLIAPLATAGAGLAILLWGWTRG